jgi:uncharacterized protein YyaL (SSP411 family)
MIALLVTGCAAAPATVPPAPADRYDIARARQAGRPQLFEWVDWTPEAFARAKAEGRFLLVDCAAEWCHWCHVMDETTYRDPEIGKLLRERFVAVRVDIDARPDLADRYAAWGWPATILLTPDARELGKYKGYLEPERMLDLLRAANTAVAKDEKPAAPLPLPEAEAKALAQMDRYYDAKAGGWGDWQKAPLGPNVEAELLRGDAAARDRALRTLREERHLLDPVWGGMYQYSAGSTWLDPHFEKIMPIQAEAIEAYARALAVTGAPEFAEDARNVVRFLDEHLSNGEGAFLVSQDADVNAHEKDKPFLDGHQFYSLAAAERARVPAPRVDDAVYPYTNGLAIAALCALHRAAPDPALVQRARAAADLVLARFVDADGGVRRRDGDSPRFLADAAAFGRGLACLAQVTGESRYREAAMRVGEALLRDFRDPATGALWANTTDPAAAGVFADRSRPFRHGVNAARFFAALADLTGDPDWRDAGRAALAALAPHLADQGRAVGAFLLALREVGPR